MSDLIKENGRLSDSGQKAIAEFKSALADILDLDKVKSMQIQELDILQVNLLSMIKDLFAEVKSR